MYRFIANRVFDRYKKRVTTGYGSREKGVAQPRTSNMYFGIILENIRTPDI